MKTKLKRINISGQMFFFTVSRNYGLPKSGPTLSVRVFLNEIKETPLTIDFDAALVADVNPFFDGVEFLNTETEENELITANNPLLIERFIKYAKQNGWNGRNVFPIIDGHKMLEEWGYMKL